MFCPPDTTIEALNISPISLLKSFDAHDESSLSKLFMLEKYMHYMSKETEELKNESTHSTVNIIEALDTEDAQEISKCIEYIISLRCSIIDKGESTPLLDGIIDNFRSIKEGVELAVSNNSSLDEDTASQVKSIKREFIKMITGATMQLTEDIQKTTCIDEVLDVRSNNNLNARTLIGQIDTSDSKEQKHLLFVASNMALLAHQGIKVSNNTPRSFLREFISLFDSSINTFCHLITSNSSTDSKKNLRMFRRIVDNMGDITDDISLDLKCEPLSSFEELIKCFLQIVTDIESTLANINAGYATAEIAQSFALVFDEQKPILERQIEEMDSIAHKLIHENKAESLESPFSESITRAKDELRAFLSLDQHVDIDTFTNTEQNITNAFESCAEQCIQMTDVTQLTYDPESASKLPNKFTLPSLPSLSSDAKLSDMVSQLLDTRVKVDEEVNSLRVLSQGATCDHTSLLEHTLSFVQCISQFITSVFSVSITSTNIKNQSDLTSVASSLANSTDLVIKASRNLFLSVTSWNSDCNKALDQVNSNIESAVSYAHEALEIFEKEEMNRDARAMMFIDAVKPVQDACSKVDEALNSLQSSEDQMFKTIASNLLNIAIAGGRVVITTLLHAKDSEKSCKDPSLMIDASNKVRDIIIKCSEITSLDSVIEICPELATTMESFDSTINSGTDTESMRTTIQQIASGSNALKSTVEKTLSSKATAAASANFHQTIQSGHSSAI